MPFLKKHIYSIPGTIISILILLIALLLNNISYNAYYVIPYIALLILGILIFSYWRSYITRTYIDKLNIWNIESLNKELLEKEQYIKMLEEDHAKLAKIIHKDNKLIPAMEYAVEQYLTNLLNMYEQDNKVNDASHRIETGRQLLADLKKLANERNGMLDKQNRECESLPQSGILRIDHLLYYMQQKALDTNIRLHVVFDCALTEFLSDELTEEDFSTLLADLIENALIATKYNGGKHVLLNIGMVGKYHAFHIFDSGIPFTKEVLVRYGQEQITTHADDSGSGIGLMQTYEILDKVNASVFIDEFTQETGLYTKKVSVVFNRLGRYTLYTTRSEQDIMYLNQRTDLTIVSK